MSQEQEELLHRLFRGGRHETSQLAALKLDDIQGFILRGYRLPMVRHFLLTVGVPAEARKLLGRSSAAARPTRRRSPPPKTGMSGSSRGLETIRPISRAVS